MAYATARPNFSFHPSSPSLSQPLPPKPRILLANPPLVSKFSPNSVSQTAPRPQFVFCSVDVSKEEKPTSDQSDSPPQEPDNFDKRRLEEKFAVLNTGIYECRSCGHKFDEAVGDPSYPIPPGLPYEKLPEDWRCPTCGAAKSFFVSKSVEIAGFAQNQQYGLGGNALTSGQKAFAYLRDFVIFLCFVLVWLLLAIGALYLSVLQG